MVQFLDQLVAIQIGIYLYERSETHNDTEQDKRKVYCFVIFCRTCLHQCKATAHPPVFKNFCLDCFSNNKVYKD